MDGDGTHHGHDDREVVVAPYGSWRSSIDLELVTGAVVALGEPWLDGDDVYWLESRAAQGGRRTLLRHTLDGATHELTPDPFKVGDRVHEYGGGSYVVDRGRIVVSSPDDGRLWRLDPEGATDPVALTPPGGARYADLRFDPARDRLYAVRETHDAAEPDRPDLVVNELVAIALDGSDGPGQVVASGADFYAAPRPSPDGTTLAWLEWDLPDMPWDATRLQAATVADDGSVGASRTLAGGPDVSIVQPAWRADGVLHFVSDEADGWWNLFAFDGPGGLDGAARNLAPMAAELGDPAWVFGRSSYGFVDDGSILAVARADGRDALLRITATGEVVPVDAPFTEVEGLQIAGGTAVLIGAGPHDGAVVARLDPHTGRTLGILARSLASPIDPGLLPHAEPIAFPTTGGATARALYYPPTNDGYRGPDGELPPLIVLSHGGPTSAAYSALSLERAFFTSRGFAVVDVDYRGSTGYGRPYRDALNGEWGIVDVDDCIAAARYLADRGAIDPRRMAIKGGSAGGYTTLAALTFRPEVFAAGISHYGIADLALIHVDGHKFESRYDERLLAPWPAGRQVFIDRSPIHAFDRIVAPMLITQGLEDKVVPPSQLDTMVAALHGRGIPHATISLEGEGHGYRRAENKRRVLAAELSFLGQVFGFTPADRIDPIAVEHLAPVGQAPGP
jgi:dipeptidyl aminopeptidase/acylaminoacyl peptidase